MNTLRVKWDRVPKPGGGLYNTYTVTVYRNEAPPPHTLLSERNYPGDVANVAIDVSSLLNQNPGDHNALSVYVRVADSEGPFVTQPPVVGTSFGFVVPSPQPAAPTNLVVTQI